MFKILSFAMFFLFSNHKQLLLQMSRSFQFNGEGGGSLMFIDPNGNVGFGTVTPMGKLDIRGDIKSTGSLVVNGVEVVSANGVIATSALPATMNTQSMSVGTIDAADITCSNMTIAGDLVVLGSNVNLDVQTVLIEDNLLVVNKNQTGVPSSLLKSGIEVERGDSPNYQFVFEEQSQLFKVGISGDLQAVATRPDTVNDGAVGYWSASNTQLVFNSNIHINSSGLNVFGAVNVSGTYVSGDINFTGALYQNGAPFSTGITSTNMTVDTSDALNISVNNNVSVLTNSTQVSTPGTPQWSSIVDGNTSDQGSAICIDPQGNVFVCGQYRSYNSTTKATNASGVQVMTLRDSSAQDVDSAYIIKYNGSGTPLWCGYIDGTNSDGATNVTCDSAGNVYVTGWYTSSDCKVYNGSGLFAFNLRIPTSQSAFVVKFTNGGSALWAVYVDGTTSEDIGRGICVDNQGNIFVTGSYSGVSCNAYNTGGTSAFTLPAPVFTGGASAFVVKFSSGGVPTWGASIGNGSGYGITFDASGSVYATGHYSSSCVIFNGSGMQTFMLRNPFSNGTYLVKFSASGTSMWGANIDTAYNGMPYDIASDASGNIVIAGYYSTGAVVCNSSGWPALILRTPSGDHSTFLVKYTPDGVPLWAATTDGESIDDAYGICTDSQCNIYMTGYYGGTPIAYNASSIPILTFPTYGGGNGFVIKYSSSGEPAWVATMRGSVTVRGCDVVADNNGGVYVMGVSYYAARMYDGSGTEAFSTPDISTNGIFLTRYTVGSFSKPQYNISSSLTPSSNGFSKILYNKSTNNSTVTVNIRNATDTSTLQALSIASGSNAKLVWVNNEWLVL